MNSNNNCVIRQSGSVLAPRVHIHLALLVAKGAGRGPGLTRFFNMHNFK